MKDEPGPIEDEMGNLLGRHTGLFGYTIGQRKGIGISRSGRYYVKRLDTDKNRLVLSQRERLVSYSLIGRDLNWFIDPPKRLIASARFGR